MRALIVIALFFSVVSWSQAPIDLYFPKQENNSNISHYALQGISNLTINYTKERFASGFQPAVESYASFDSSFHYRAAAGIAYSNNWKKWQTKQQWISGWSARETATQNHSAFMPFNNHAFYWFNDIRSRTTYSNRRFTASAGIDNQFIGDGYRSLVLSSQGRPLPYANFKYRLWRFEYGILYQGLHENNDSLRSWKFSTTHYLSTNISEKWNVTLIEQVIFQPKDGQFKRGFEVEYLNPFVFFRPQEYSLGSSDNVVLGLNSSYRFKHWKIYGQVSLDEFVLAEIRARSKWWANKYGAQLGVKGNFGNHQLLVEGNLVRPYTYSHINNGQNWASLGYATGHLEGSNFAELLVYHRYNWKRMVVESNLQFLLKGYDVGGYSWGGDLYQSYVNRPPDKEYGNTIGQGNTQRRVQAGLSCIYPLPKKPISIYATAMGTSSWGDLGSKQTGIVIVGIRSELFQVNRQF